MSDSRENHISGQLLNDTSSSSLAIKSVYMLTYITVHQ